MGLFTNLNLKPSNQFDGVRLEGLTANETYTGILTGDSLIREFDGYDIPYIEVVLDDDDVESRWLKLSLSNSDSEFFDKYEAEQLKGCSASIETALYKGYVYASNVDVSTPKKSTPSNKKTTSLKK